MGRWLVLMALSAGLLGCGGESTGEGAPAPAPVIEERTAEELEAERQAREAERLAAEERERHQRALEEAERFELEAQAALDQAAAAEAARLEAERRVFEETYPFHGVCYHFLAQVFSRANRRRVVGYMRRGAVFRAKEGVRGPDCDGLWHETPGGGFVCAGSGYRLGRNPQTFEDSPVQPDIANAMPYRYAYMAGDNIPQFWRSPSTEERLEAAAAMAVLVAEEEALAAAAEREAESVPDAGAEPSDSPEEPPSAALEVPTSESSAVEAAPLDEDAISTPTGDDEEAEGVPDADEAAGGVGDAVVEASAPPGQEAQAEPEGSGEEESPNADEAEERALPSYVRLRMRRGFYVSLDAEERSENPAFARTVRGGYIQRDSLQENDAPAGRGVVVGGDWQLPIGFVYRPGTRSLRRDAEGGPLRLEGTLEPHTAFIVDDSFERRRRAYAVSPDGLIVRRRALRVAEAVERPSDVGPSQQWVHVDLSEQTLVAYEGDQPVFATMIASGKEGFETPTGLFRIESKHITTTMDDLENEDAPYSIEDVPWTMYFSGNYALHAAFWHDRFGRPRSHGCINMTPTDARWLFQWSTPLLPQGWHGMFVQRRAERAWVYITD